MIEVVGCTEAVGLAALERSAKMKTLLLALILLSLQEIGANPKLVGIWVPHAKHGLVCVCNHDTQLKIVALPNAENGFSAVEYCIGHSQASPLGNLVVKDGKIQFLELEKQSDYSLSEDGNTLTLRGDTVLGADALVLVRLDSEAFLARLAKLEVASLVLGRGSLLFDVQEKVISEKGDDPFSP